MDCEAELLIEIRKAIRGYPQHKVKIINFCRLAVDEITSGGSATHKYELFMGELNEINQRKEK